MTIHSNDQFGPNWAIKENKNAYWLKTDTIFLNWKFQVNFRTK